ncbi:MAG: alpha/beta hydrolase [Candidatus Heimdallarchaeota archaeon]|nr:alpha/beta hydrolase [Candidatus Heimdallarchaeota archaeon]
MSYLEKDYPNAKNIQSAMCQVGDGEKLRVLKFEPKDCSIKKHTIIFIPGFMGLFNQWSKMLNGLLLLGFTLYIIETREKKSSTATPRSDRISQEGFALDIAEIMKILEISSPYSFMGTSLGVGIIIDQVIHNFNLPKMPEKLILLNPIYKSEHLSHLIRASFLPFICFYLIIKSFILLAPLTMYKIKKKDQFLYRIRLESLNHASIKKMRKALQASINRSIYNELSWVKIPSLILSKKGDKEHPFTQALEISTFLHDSILIDIYSEEVMHDFQTTYFITNFLNNF